MNLTLVGDHRVSKHASHVGFIFTHTFQLIRVELEEVL